MQEILPTTSASDAEAIGRSAIRKAGLRLIPVIGIGYCLSYMDRINISFASLRMNEDLHFSATVYSIGAGLFFIGYALFEIPSNLLLMRFGAKRWIARIMVTWGILAACMMFVRTPIEFNILRFLLGVAEAGFFPGVLYYLTLWFPADMRARAVSRFYISLPLSSVVMGSVAGWLMGLNGKLGLSGWQWLFLVEGLPAALFSIVILKMLPDTPDQAKWLTSEEKNWLQNQLDADSTLAHLGHHDGLLKAILSPKVLLFGLCCFCALTCTYAYGFSAPAILQGATGWSVTNVGFLVAGFGVLGALAMLLNGAHSDRHKERLLHVVIPYCIMAAGYIVASYTHIGWIVVVALGVSYTCLMGAQPPALAVPMQFLTGRSAAAGIAMLNMIAMFGGFVGPYWMGVMKDATGSYQAGLRGLALPALLSAGFLFTLVQILKRRRTAPMTLATEVAD
jgi:ACS family tartrate transporter-like MFS transporter